MKRISSGWIIALAAMAAALVLLLLVFQVSALAAPVAALQEGEPDQEELAEAVEAAIAWLVETHQNADGGYSSFSAGADQGPSDIGGTLDALWALGVSGANVSELIAYLEANPDQLAEYVAQDGSTAGKALLSLAPTGRDVRDFAGLDLIVSVTDHLSPSGQFGVDTAFNQSLAILALSSADESVNQESVSWLIDRQAADGDFVGSWDDGFGTAGNPDSTAMALFALTISGQESAAPAIEAGLDFLEQAQLDTGGWEYATGFGENANSTALVTLALTMLGEDLYSEDSRWVREGQDPLTALLGWQGESGAFQADFGDGPFDDFFSTVQSLPTLGFIQLRTGGGPLQATAVAAPEEMTPTATPAAEEPTAIPTLEEATPEPTEVPPSPTAEEVAAATDDDDSAAPTATVADAPAEQEDDDGGSSIAPWIIAVGAIVVVGGLAWWFMSRRQEA